VSTPRPFFVIALFPPVVTIQVLEPRMEFLFAMLASSRFSFSGEKIKETT
jgi:hypothetical protein